MGRQGIDQVRDPESSSLKAHIGSDITSITTGAWTDFPGFSVNASESPRDDVFMQGDNTTFEFRRAGLYRFTGCVKVENNTTGSITATVLVRLLKNGTDEMRCSQRQLSVSINQDEQYTLTYGGSDEIVPGDTVTLQYYTDNVDLTFGANQSFANPSTATFATYYDGVLP
jgi:hypothetical protein